MKEEDKQAGYGQIGDQWLREQGYVAPQVHQTLGLTIKAKFPFLKDFEYICSTDQRKVQVNLYVSIWSRIFRSHSKMIDFIYDLLLENLPGYEVAVLLRRYKGGINATKPTSDPVIDISVARDRS